MKNYRESRATNASKIPGYRKRMSNVASEAFGFLLSAAVVLVIIVNVISGCEEIINNPVEYDTYREQRWERFGY